MSCRMIQVFANEFYFYLYFIAEISKDHETNYDEDSQSQQ